MIVNKIGITYYSLFGLTKRIAEDISLLTEGELIPVTPMVEYSFDYNTASKEIRGQIERGFCPELRGGVPSYAKFDVVFIGTPNWFRTMAPPLRTVVRKSDLGQQVLIPFCAHGGGGMGDIEKDLMTELPKGTFKKGLALGQGYTLTELRDWLDRLGIEHG